LHAEQFEASLRRLLRSGKVLKRRFWLSGGSHVDQATLPLAELPSAVKPSSSDAFSNGAFKQ